MLQVIDGFCDGIVLNGVILWCVTTLVGILFIAQASAAAALGCGHPGDKDPDPSTTPFYSAQVANWGTTNPAGRRTPPRAAPPTVPARQAPPPRQTQTPPARQAQPPPARPAQAPPPPAARPHPPRGLGDDPTAVVVGPERLRVVAQPTVNLINLVLVLDKSGSMGGARWNSVVRGVQNALDAISDSDMVRWCGGAECRECCSFAPDSLCVSCRSQSSHLIIPSTRRRRSPRAR